MGNQASTVTSELVQLDPRSLAEHPANIRIDLGDVTELAASIRSVGVLEPIVVVPVGADEDSNDSKNGNDEGSGYRIIAGHRRVAAAIAAKQQTVPCIVRADLTGDVDQITGMIVENVLRANLTPAEEAAAYAQLAAFDLTPAAIAKRTGRPTKKIRDSLALHALPEQVKQRVADQAMTLEDAAAIEEFADDPKAHARLLKAADNGYGLKYAIADERHRKEKKQRTVAAKAALTEQGVKVVGAPKGWPYYCKEARVTDLALVDGVTRYSVDKHADCPGHAAFLDHDAQPVFICRDPDEQGHTRLSGTNYVTPEEAERREAAAAAREARADDLAVAATVRRDFLRTLIGQPKVPVDFHRACLLILFGYGLDTDRTHPTLVADLLGVTRGDDGLGTAYAKRLDQTGEQRLWQHPVAHGAALAETNLDRAATGRTWGYRPGLTTHWLDLLTALGHERSEVEQAVYDEAAASAAENADDLDDEDYDDDDAVVNDDDTDDAQHDDGTVD
jgi:ParB family chromosome partitioning protein